MNQAAQQLGRMGKGHPKTLTDAERARRAEWARGLAARCKAGRTKAEARQIIAGAVADGAIERAK
jgi:hypothetical protein